MNCHVVRDLIEGCAACKKLLEDMGTPTNVVSVSEAPAKLSKLSEWKASVLQSVLLFLSFGLVTIGVSLEAGTGAGLMNGFWAMNLVVPATGFMLSMVNWYFVRVYKDRKRFSSFSLITTLAVTLCAYIWSGFHYEMDLSALFSGLSFAEVFHVLRAMLLLNGLGIILTVVFCILSKTLSDQYAKMLGKE